MAELTKGEKRAMTKRANFYIIRKLWGVIRGKPHDGQTVYKKLGMSRPRYERLIYGENTRITADEYASWKALGISEDIVDGEVLIKIDHLSFDECVNFLTAWDNRKKGENEQLKYVRMREYVDGKIEKTDIADIRDDNFARVCQLIKNTKPVASNPGIKMAVAQNHVLAITPGDLLEIGQRALQDYIEGLTTQLKMAEAIYTIRSYQEGWDKKQGK